MRKMPDKNNTKLIFGQKKRQTQQINCECRSDDIRVWFKIGDKNNR